MANQQIVFKTDKFHWLDVVDPTKEELTEIAKKYGIHRASVKDCLDSEHLPKFERIGDHNFVILRSSDESAAHEADTVQELTRKLALFYNDSFLITIHRKDQPYIAQLRTKWKKLTTVDGDVGLNSKLLYDLLSGVFNSYQVPIDQSLDQLEKLEMGVFGAHGGKPFHIKEGYYLKRKAFVYRRMLRLFLEILPKMNAGLQTPINSPDHQDLKEIVDGLHFYSEELIESVTSLLNLHISLSSQQTNEASHRTNEVVRVLTIISMFLLPLNVITGIYGMNFEHMPELKFPLAYPLVLLGMVLITSLTYVWFRRKGWMKLS